MKYQKNLQQNNSEKFPNKNVKEIPKKRYIFPKERQKTFDNLRKIND